MEPIPYEFPSLADFHSLIENGEDGPIEKLVTDRLQQLIDQIYDEGGGAIKFPVGERYPIGYFINSVSGECVPGIGVRAIRTGNPGDESQLQEWASRGIILKTKAGESEEPFLYLFCEEGNVTFHHTGMPQEPWMDIDSGQQLRQFVKSNFDGIADFLSAHNGDFVLATRAFIDHLVSVNTITPEQRMTYLGLIDANLESLKDWDHLRLIFHGHRLFNTENTSAFGESGTSSAYDYYKDTIDSGIIRLENIHFDGDISNQWQEQTYETEQAALLFLMANKYQNASFTGRLRVELENCHFKDHYADGAHIYVNVNGSFKNCSASHIYRGGLTFTGGGVNALVENYEGYGDAELNSQLLVEVDAYDFKREEGHNYQAEDQPYQLDLTIRGGSARTMKLVTHYKSRFLVEDFKVKGLYTQSTIHSQTTCRNVTFQTYPFFQKVRVTPFNLKWAGDSTYEGCCFECLDGSLGVPSTDKIQHLVNVNFVTRAYNKKGALISEQTRQRLNFVGCKFENHSDHRLVSAVKLHADKKEFGNQLMLHEPQISGHAKHAFFFDGGNAVIRRPKAFLRTNNEQLEPTHLYGYSISPEMGLQCKLNGLEPDDFSTSKFANLYRPDEDTAIHHYDVKLYQSQNKLVALNVARDLRSTEFLGQRTIVADGEETPDSANVPGLVNDLFIAESIRVFFRIGTLAIIVFPTVKKWECRLSGYGNAPAQWSSLGTRLRWTEIRLFRRL